MRVEMVAASDDPEQLKLDLEDARKRLDGIQRAILEEDEARDEVGRLTRELAQARRRLKEAGYKRALLCAPERREAYAKRENGNGKSPRRDS